MNPLLSIIKRIRDTYPPGLRVAAIGSRRLTKPQLLHMQEALSELAPNISLLRSGGAIGADTLAEVTAARHNIPAEIFLPSSRQLQNRRLTSNFQPYGEFDPYNYELQQEVADALASPKGAPISYIEQASPAAYKLARERGLPEPYIDLMARNMHQVFGPNLDNPSDLILAMPQQRGSNWHGGGTRHAMAAALDANIPVFDLSAPSHARYTGVDPNLPLLQLLRAHTRGPVPNPSTYNTSKFKWQRHGGYEVSTKGDPRFSALVARLPNGRTIEDVYQNDIKPRLGNVVGKGQYDPNVPIEKYYEAYKELWREWVKNNPQLFNELKTQAAKSGGVLSDRFASRSVNQARALSELLNELNPSTYNRTPTPAPAPRQRAFNIVPDTGDYDVRAMRYNGRTMANTSPEDYGKRNSGWLGNPHTWSGNDKSSKLSIDDAINLFKRDFLAKIESDPAFRQAVLNLRGKRIGYYKPDAPQSHVQVILDWLESQAPSTPTARRYTNPEL